MSSVEIIKPRWKSCTRTSREDRWSRNKGRQLVQSLTKWLTVVTNEKLREWTQNHPPVQVASLNIPEYSTWILTNRGLWITVHHCARRKKNSIICVANLHSLQWNITSMAHKIRTTLKRRWIFKRASGIRCLHDGCKKRGLLEKQQRRQQQSCVNTPEDKVQLKKRKAPSRVQNLDSDSWMTVEKIFFETLIFKYAYFDTPWSTSREEASAKLIGKIIHVWGLVALPSPPKL